MPPAARGGLFALAAAAIVLLAALCAQLTLRVLAPQARPYAGAAAVTIELPPRASTIPTPAPALASPAAGTTGTIALPPLPADAALALPGDAAIVAARPFSAKSASGVDRGRALECLSAAIYYEAASEPDDGQRAVAQVVLNRVRHPVFPSTVCGVVYQGSERSGCQFSFACDGAMARIPSRSGWARATRVAAAALGGYVFASVGLATHYHTYAVTPAWNRTLVMTDAIGAHFFHRWKGYWGTPAAFTQRYVGHEPVPGPHQRSDVPPVIALAGAIAPVTTPAPVTPVAQVQPAHADSGRAITAPPPSASLPGDSQILDRWKDSGTPLQ